MFKQPLGVTKKIPNIKLWNHRSVFRRRIEKKGKKEKRWQMWTSSHVTRIIHVWGGGYCLKNDSAWEAHYHELIRDAGVFSVRKASSYDGHTAY